jgi:iron complex outermembrane receptor protein
MKVVSGTGIQAAGAGVIRRALVTLAALVLAAPLRAQDTATVALTVEARRDTVPIADVIVRAGDIVRPTDAEGRAVFRLAPGEWQVITAKIGYAVETLTVALRVGTDTTVQIALTPRPLELSGIIVSATRSGRRIEDEPLRVEVLSQEEVEEKLLMTPGDITMMLNESSGLRVQTTSPSLGSANVRVQGLRGRYTQILADGLPLYGGQTGGLGLLQIPPMDLGAVEIIKGAASALYGGSALGGVINLISRRPEEDPVRELLLNQTTLGGTDAVGFASAQGDEWGYTVLAGGHRQSQVDPDDDGWADLPRYRRLVVRPRAFWSSPNGHSLMFTAGTTVERREGGSMDGESPRSGEYPEHLRTNRYDAGVVGGFLIGSSMILSVRGAAVMQQHRQTFGILRERDEHLTQLGESSITIPHGMSLWVIGAAVQQERYRGEDVDRFDFDHVTPGAFVQNTVTISPAVSVTASARVDRHSEYGTQLAPRLSALFRVSPEWTVRASAGGGYFAPTPFTEEMEVIPLQRLEFWRDIEAERVVSASLDLGGTVGEFEVNATLFGSRVAHPVALRRSLGRDDLVHFVSLDMPTRTTGGELLLRWNPEPFHVTGSYTFVRSREQDPATGERREAPLTPRHQAGIVTMWEQEGRARAGVEIYYTGVQALDDNPYRDESKPYVHVGVLAERRFGAARVFVNAENLLDFRQTRYDPLLLESPGLGERWTTDVWGPLEGRVANVGVRLDLK